MNKKCLIILKGYELMQEIANKRMKEGTKFRDLTDNDCADYRNIYRYENNNFIGRWGGTNILKLLNHDFEILEDEEEIDIKEIKEFPVSAIEVAAINENEKLIAYKINDLVKAVKQLDKKIDKED